MSTHYLLDISRLLSRAERPTPTGIDRVELAYAQHFIAAVPDRLSFTALTYSGRLGPLPFPGVVRFVKALESHWRGDARAKSAGQAAARIAQALRLRAFVRGEQVLYRRTRRMGADTVYLLVSHHHLDRPLPIRRLKRRTGARFVCLIHDLIPIEFPEYARPGQTVRHRRRMETVGTLADAAIVNSEATAASLRAFLERANQTVPLVVVPLGIQTPAMVQPEAQSTRHPYFICIGTIEPKKNHLLLLNIWRRFASERGGSAPHLVLVGHRGWENENVIDMIERSAALRGLVEEHNSLQDLPMHRLLAGAKALLMPSFGEGYGLPVAEALALGVPVLCSDLPVLRAVGGDAPDYLDPLDGPAWHRAILDYAQAPSPRREAQLRRLSAWRAPTWPEHFARVEALLDRPANER